ncbi:MAG: ATPase, T2SS/T4P/T4SS family, partial [Bacillota bacterium]
MSLLKRLELQKQTEQPVKGPEKAKAAAAPVRSDPYQSLKTKIHRRIIEEMSSEENRKLLAEDAEPGTLEPAVDKIANTVMDEETVPVPRAERTKIIAEVVDEVLGYGPIDHLLKDDSISEVMVNSASQVYVERKGKLVLTEAKFRDDAHVMHVIEKIVAPLGRRIDESSPMVDARLPDGSRVNAIIPPLALKGPSITIRK